MWKNKSLMIFWYAKSLHWFKTNDKWSTAHTDSALSDGVVVKGPPGTAAAGQGGVSWWGVEGSALGMNKKVQINQLEYYDILSI